MLLEVVLAMLVVGLLLGFVGAGGSGFIIAVLTVVFGVPLQTALGTALAAMIFSSFSGAFSHYREGNAVLKVGVVAGGAGAAGALLATQYSDAIPSENLKLFTAGMLILSGLALWLRMALVGRRSSEEGQAERTKGSGFWMGALGVGFVTGVLSGLFGIGSTPFIQIGLMTFLRLSPRQAAGTTMLVIWPIALGGGAGYYSQGHLDLFLLAEVVAGVTIGSYIGAKFTKRLPAPVLRTAMVLTPMIGGVILLM